MTEEDIPDDVFIEATIKFANHFSEYVKENGHLFYCYDIAQIITGLSDESINKYSDEQIIAIAVKAMEMLAKKKLMK